MTEIWRTETRGQRGASWNGRAREDGRQNRAAGKPITCAGQASEPHTQDTQKREAGSVVVSECMIQNSRQQIELYKKIRRETNTKK